MLNLQQEKITQKNATKWKQSQKSDKTVVKYAPTWKLQPKRRQKLCKNFDENCIKDATRWKCETSNKKSDKTGTKSFVRETDFIITKKYANGAKFLQATKWKWQQNLW